MGRRAEQHPNGSEMFIFPKMFNLIIKPPDLTMQVGEDEETEEKVEWKKEEFENELLNWRKKGRCRGGGECRKGATGERRWLKRRGGVKTGRTMR